MGSAPLKPVISKVKCSWLYHVPETVRHTMQEVHRRTNYILLVNELLKNFKPIKVSSMAIGNL